MQVVRVTDTGLKMVTEIVGTRGNTCGQHKLLASGLFRTILTLCNLSGMRIQAGCVMRIPAHLLKANKGRATC